MANGITLLQAIRVFEKELGCGGDNAREDLIDIIQASLEFMLFNGGGSILREWIVPVRYGRFTLPRDLETPIKYKLGETANSGFGTINSPFYSYGSQSVSSCCGYSDWDSKKIEIKANTVPTQFAAPSQGIQVIATTLNPLDVGKKIMINGHRCGNPILPTHRGHKTAGELLPIFLETDPEKKYSAFMFDKITGVIKDLTCDYVMLSGIDRDENCFFLSHYTPDEEVPQYREGQLFQCSYGCSDSCDFNLYVLGRVQTGIRYIRNEDILPVNSIEILRLLAKRARYDQSGDFKEVAAMENRIKQAIKYQVAYQQAATRQLSYNLAATGASLNNI